MTKVTFANVPFSVNLTVGKTHKVIDFNVTPVIELPDELAETLTSSLPQAYKKVESKPNDNHIENELKDNAKDNELAELLNGLKKADIIKLAKEQYPNIKIDTTLNKTDLVESILAQIE